MSVKALLKELQSLGNERHRATFERHGITGPLFGVPYADLYRLQKRIGVDHELAKRLWLSGIHDARILATFIADPAQITAKELDVWATTVNNALNTDALATLAAKTDHATHHMQRWMGAKHEWRAASGWHLLSALCTQPTPPVSDAELLAFLDEIESSIHSRDNRVRYSMNGALIAIGGRGGALQTRALAVAKAIGVVDVDHGNTSCKTPDATSYIKKIATRRKAKAGKKKASKAPAARKATKKKASKAPAARKATKKKGGRKKTTKKTSTVGRAAKARPSKKKAASLRPAKAHKKKASKKKGLRRKAAPAR